MDQEILYIIETIAFFVYSNITLLPNFSIKTGMTAKLTVISYSIAVQYVFFVHGTISYTWLPHRNAILTDDSFDRR